MLELHQLTSFTSRYWCYNWHRSVHFGICFDLAINQIAKIGLSSLQVIYYFEILFIHRSIFLCEILSFLSEINKKTKI
ncbi:hypothetical protein BDD26_0664 [Xenorhabdus cabanillasii]|uniref:Uncharacterized protein n=1 Tax=Xenorhabdus cabanillasii TaxID=351673 RepID=A0A3D9UJA3_9GAMM|nr:hypothetical protein BDD26_0664 [Xenorhabdus cabanillasii]